MFTRPYQYFKFLFDWEGALIQGGAAHSRGAYSSGTHCMLNDRHTYSSCSLYEIVPLAVVVLLLISIIRVCVE